MIINKTQRNDVKTGGYGTQNNIWSLLTSQYEEKTMIMMMMIMMNRRKTSWVQVRQVALSASENEASQSLTLIGEMASVIDLDKIGITFSFLM